jgi:hypothetical protein
MWLATATKQTRCAQTVFCLRGHFSLHFSSPTFQGHRGARRDSHSKDYLLRAVREHKKESGFPQKQKALRNMQRAFHLL